MKEERNATQKAETKEGINEARRKQGGRTNKVRRQYKKERAPKANNNSRRHGMKLQ